MNVAIGIVTKGRTHQALALIHRLSHSLSSSDVIIVVENGTHELNNRFSSYGTRVLYSHLSRPSIPQARNTVISLVPPRCTVLAFIDDDCTPTDQWVSYIKSRMKKHEHIEVLQGKILYQRFSSVYAQVSLLLYDLWMRHNTQGMITRILDTKNVVFRMSVFATKKYVFNPKFSFASDIELGARLQQRGITIYWDPALSLYHRERETLRAFIYHRFRLSHWFRRVCAMYPGMYQSASVWDKCIYLWKNLACHPLKKLYMLLLLCGIYSFVSVSNMLEVLQYRLLKFFFRKA